MKDNRKAKLISVIIPVYNEEGNIEKLHERLNKTLEQLPSEKEYLFVNDGSDDRSLMLLAKLSEEDKHVKVVNFSRNFGHQVAVSAGLQYAKGEAVVIIDADLQDPPEVILELYKKWQQGYEVINARRRSRQEGFFKVLTAKLFYKFLNLVVSNEIPENVGDFRMLDRKAVNVLNKLAEKDRYLRGLTNWIGFKQAFVEFDRDQRYTGKTHYPIRKMLKLAFDAIFSFSSYPLKIANLLAIFFILLALVVIAYTIYLALQGTTVPGWASQMTVVAIFSAIQLFVLGIISEYISRIYTQVQDRPLYIVTDTINI